MPPSAVISWIGLQEFARLVFFTKAKIPTLIKSNVRLGGKILKKAMKSQLVGQGPKRPRGRRKDSGSKLRNVSGQLKRAIGFGTRIRKREDKFILEVGPRGIAWYSMLHELGIGFKQRQFVTPAVVSNADRILTLLGKTAEVK
jgi:hypothetical protein